MIGQWFTEEVFARRLEPVSRRLKSSKYLFVKIFDEMENSAPVIPPISKNRENKKHGVKEKPSKWEGFIKLFIFSF